MNEFPQALTIAGSDSGGVLVCKLILKLSKSAMFLQPM